MLCLVSSPLEGVRGLLSISLEGSTLPAFTLALWNKNINRKCFEYFMSQYVGISKRKIAIISLGKMPNG